jgi:hypothetical protein
MSKSLSIPFVTEEEACVNEIQKLSSWILKNCPKEIGKGDPKHGESAVEVAIRLMNKQIRRK